MNVVAESYTYDLICIGSGPASQRAAVQAAKFGRRVAVVEKDTLGGVCIHTGTVPSKTFREAVMNVTAGANPFTAGRSMRKANRPTAEQLFDRVAEIAQREGAVIQDQLERNRISIYNGTASFVGPHAVRVDGHVEITGANIFVGVGASAARPDDVPIDGVSVVTSDEIPHMRELPRTLAVIGCGIIGIEYASIFGALGVDVTTVDGRDRPLEFLDTEIVDELVHQMRGNNVTFRLGERVARIEVTKDGPRRALVHLESGKRIVAEMALFAIGRVGATDDLNLAAAGLSADQRGRMEVDAAFRTEVPHIFAGGDVVGYPSLAATSSEQGRLATCHAFGVEANHMAEHFPIGVYAVPEVSMVGPTEETLTQEKVPYETGVARYREIARGQILGDDSGFLKMLVHREDRRLLAVHAVGTGATELIHIGQTVIALGGGLDYLLEAVFNYPTLAECYKVAALDAHNKLSI